MVVVKKILLELSKKELALGSLIYNQNIVKIQNLRRLNNRPSLALAIIPIMKAVIFIRNPFALIVLFFIICVLIFHQ
jgi:hypothetical protein